MLYQNASAIALAAPAVARAGLVDPAEIAELGSSGARFV